MIRIGGRYYIGALDRDYTVRESSLITRDELELLGKSPDDVRGVGIIVQPEEFLGKFRANRAGFSGKLVRFYGEVKEADRAYLCLVSGRQALGRSAREWAEEVETYEAARKCVARLIRHRHVMTFERF